MDLRAFVANLPRTSALVRAQNPDAWVTPDIRLLREVAYLSHLGIWVGADPRSRGPAPEPIPLTEAERKASRAAAWQFDAVPLDEFDEVLAARQRRAS